MKFSLFILSFLVAVLFLGLRPLSNPVHITGHLRENPKDTSAYVEGLHLFVKGNNKVLAKTVTDNKGGFKLTFTPNKEKSFDFYCSGVAVDTLLIGSVKRFESDTPEMTFYIPAQKRKISLVKLFVLNVKKRIKYIKLFTAMGCLLKLKFQNRETLRIQIFIMDVIMLELV